MKRCTPSVVLFSLLLFAIPLVLHAQTMPRGGDPPTPPSGGSDVYSQLDPRVLAELNTLRKENDQLKETIWLLEKKADLLTRRIRELERPQ